jgi:hypothetical protein
MLFKLLIFNGEMFTILKRKVESTQVANGGSLNYPPLRGLSHYMILTNSSTS